MDGNNKKMRTDPVGPACDWRLEFTGRLYPALVPSWNRASYKCTPARTNPLNVVLVAQDLFFCILAQSFFLFHVHRHTQIYKTHLCCLFFFALFVVVVVGLIRRFPSSCSRADSRRDVKSLVVVWTFGVEVVGISFLSLVWHNKESIGSKKTDKRLAMMPSWPATLGGVDIIIITFHLVFFWLNLLPKAVPPNWILELEPGPVQLWVDGL